MRGDLTSADIVVAVSLYVIVWMVMIALPWLGTPGVASWRKRIWMCVLSHLVVGAILSIVVVFYFVVDSMFGARPRDRWLWLLIPPPLLIFIVQIVLLLRLKRRSDKEGPLTGP